MKYFFDLPSVSIEEIDHRAHYSKYLSKYVVTGLLRIMKITKFMVELKIKSLKTADFKSAV